MQSRRRKLVKDLKERGELRGSSTAGALPDLLYDELTDLPTVPLLLGRIRRLLKESRQLGLLSISVLQNERGEQTLGWRGTSFWCAASPPSWSRSRRSRSGRTTTSPR